MKPIIIYAVIFILAFILTSFGIIQLNSKFNNIFKFDFSPKSSLVIKTDKSNLSDSTKVKTTAQEPPIEQKTENIKEPAVENNPQVDSVSTTAKEIDKSSETLSAKNSNNNPIKETATANAINNNSSDEKINVVPALQTVSKVDSSYLLWEKKTAKVYESMDPKKAAKIIQNFSDNMARDIIYAMKKNKAADVLGELDPAFAARIMRMP